MKKIYSISLVLIALAIFGTNAYSQRRTPVRKPTPRPLLTVAQADVRDAKQAASNQHFNVNGYLTKFTPLVDVANGLAKDEKAGKLSTRAKTDFSNFKRGLSTTLGDFKVGLTNLENSFRTKPALTRYLIKIQGISDLATTAEAAANSQRYEGVREALKGIVQRLSDTIAVMPK